MKRNFILLFLLAMSLSSLACPVTMTQSGWRWRNNDGSEATATWKAAQTTPITYGFNNEVVRLRVETINNTRQMGSLPEQNQCIYPAAVVSQDSLQYSTNIADASSWRNVGTDAAKAFTLAGANAFVTQNDATTPQLTGTSNAFSPGKMMVTDTIFKNTVIQGTARTEVEWAIKGTANMLPNTSYYFRLRRMNYVYNTYPSLTTSTPLPVKFVRLVANAEGKKNRLEWTVAAEQYNDRFEMERSIGGAVWQTIATVKSNGPSNTAVTYATYDNDPPPGTAYYRLRQVDKDGTATYSEVRSVTRPNEGVLVSVWPNPAKETIRFYWAQTATTQLQAVLIDASGKIVHREAFTNLQPGTLHTLNLSHPPTPGMYLLQLTGSSYSTSIKVVVL